jgi:hypothetical protein
MKHILIDLRDNNGAINPLKKPKILFAGRCHSARSDIDQRQLTDINALLEEAVQLAHSRRSLDRSFNVTIYTEYESAIALSEVVFSDLTPAFINILDGACYGVFQKPKNW